MSAPAESHAPGCKWKEGGEGCRRFSTDGTRLGSQIAHEMGTTDEDAIARMAEQSVIARGRASLTGMPEEQADWEGYYSQALWEGE